MQIGLYVHFLKRNVHDTVIIVEEVTYPTHVSASVIFWFRGHPSQCNKRLERNWRSLVMEEARSGTERTFSAYRCLLTKLMAFNLLRLVLKASDDDWLDVVGNLLNALNNWTLMSRILGMDGGIFADSGDLLQGCGTGGSTRSF